MRTLAGLLLIVFILSANAQTADAEEQRSDRVARLFLQQVSSTSAIVKWRGNGTRLSYGLSRDTLETEVTAEADGDHMIAQLTGLTPDQTYYYRVNDTPEPAWTGAFQTAPSAGQSPNDGNIRVWLLGDSGTESEESRGHFPYQGQAAKVREGFKRFQANQGQSEPIDLILLLGDNAYLEGTDLQWQRSFFEIYAEDIKGASVWPTIGNHEMGLGQPIDLCSFRPMPACEKGPVMVRFGGVSESSDPNSYDSDGNGPDEGGLPYLNIFTLPTDGELGGSPSHTEQYYSFDYGNLHVVSLDSQLSNRDPAQRAVMRDWLIRDLSASGADWTIVFFHHPPYSKGENHDSDREQNEIDMRTTFGPVFENYGVDAVYSGHAHSYERSWYLRGHQGPSTEFSVTKHAARDDQNQATFGTADLPYLQAKGMNTGRTIYTVAGTGGKADGYHPCAEGQYLGCTTPDWLMHPAHRTFNPTMTDYRPNGIAKKGTVLLDVGPETFSSRFIDEEGQVLDHFVIQRQ